MNADEKKLYFNPSTEIDYSKNTELCSHCGIVHKEEQSILCPECNSKRFLRTNPKMKRRRNSKCVWICSKCGYYKDGE